MATVGELRRPARRVQRVPGRVELTLDVRHQTTRSAADARALHAATRRSRRAAAIDVSWATIHTTSATPCSPALASALAAAVAAPACRRELPERRRARRGDAGRMTDIAMLFVRSHAAAATTRTRSVTEADVALAIEAATRFACSSLIVRGGHVVTPDGVVRPTSASATA